MTEMVTSGSMSGKRKRSDGPLGESDHERRRSLQAPPVLHATAPLPDSTFSPIQSLQPASRVFSPFMGWVVDFLLRVRSRQRRFS
jgi:hypothetical protein